MENDIAQIKLGPEGGFRGFGTLGLEGKPGFEAPVIFNNFISTTIGVMTVVAFIWFVIQFFLGALGILFSGGDKAKVAEARQKITTALIGLVVVIAAIFLIDVIGAILGVDLILNPALFILQTVQNQ